MVKFYGITRSVTNLRIQDLEIYKKKAHLPLTKLSKERTREMITHSATVITHPFHVITLRSMIQFIGRETKYCGLCDSIATIYREERILAFFAGLIPRLLADICNSLAYLNNTYALDSGVSTMFPSCHKIFYQ
jgi:hypothetical protein